MPSTAAPLDDPARAQSGRRLSGAAADSARRATERRAHAEEHLGEFQAFAQLMVELVGIDTIRARLGRDKALRLIRLAGGDAERIGANWAAAEPVRRQLSKARPSEGYDRDPRHDPRVVKAILSGAPTAEINRLIGEVTDELLTNPLPTVGPPGTYRDQPADTAIPGVSYAEVGGVRVPVQRSTTFRDWSEFPDHQPGFEERVSPGVGGAGMPITGLAPPPAPVMASAMTPVPEPDSSQESMSAGCQHEGIPPGAKFCPRCGTGLGVRAGDGD
jgi:hypothetical protein